MILSTVLQDEPMIIVKPIAIFLGYILNFIYNITYNISPETAFGLSIIFFTMIVRALMIPLAIKQQKSMSKMQALAPEIEKIRKKYGDSKDPEVQKKINVETQALYSNQGVNPFGGCLPIIIQFPIFIALSYIMQQSYLFVDKMGYAYRELATLVMQVKPDWVDAIRPMASIKVLPGKKFDIGIFDNLQKLIYTFTEADWAQYLTAVSADLQAQMQPLIEATMEISNLTYFLGIDLLKTPEIFSVGVLIPILSAVTGFLSSWIALKMTVTTDPNAKLQQRIMMTLMPLMMGYFTLTFPAGVGLYWVSSSVFQLCQQLVMNKYYAPILAAPVSAAKPAEKASAKKK